VCSEDRNKNEAVVNHARGPALHRALYLTVFLSLPLLLGFLDAAAEEEATAHKELVGQYARALRELCSGPAGCGPALGSDRLDELIRLIHRLLAVPNTEPEVLQAFPFVDSYEVLFQLEGNPRQEAEERVAEWRKRLKELDTKAYRVNRFSGRPAARWVVGKARSIPAEPTHKMLAGYIEREQGTVYVSPEGERCQSSRGACERVRYVLLQGLVPGVHDPREARDRFHAFPPERANRRVTHYWEVLLQEEILLLRRNYRLKPLPGYEGTMENYHRLAFRDPQRIVIAEENARVGRFILQNDTAAAYIRSPPHGVTVALLFTGRYAMEGFFRMIVGDKTLTEPLEVLSILRQYMMAPERGVEYAVWAGQKDYNENQAP